jgi:hypothetical protein
MYMHDAGWSESPFSVPIAAFIAWAAVVGFKSLARFNVRKLQSQERLLAIEKGQPLPPDDPAEPFEEKGRRSREKSAESEEERVAGLRTGGIVCLAVGVGLAVFGALLAHILDVRAVLSVSASGLIPMAIGVGLLVDVRLRSKSLAEPPPQ